MTQQTPPMVSTSLKVSVLPAFSDNYIWVIHDPIKPKNIAVVDPGDANVVETALDKNGWSLKTILITHHHADHTGGLLALKRKYSPVVYGPAMEMIKGIDQKLSHAQTIDVEGMDLVFEIIDLPGHTMGHIAYYGHGAVFCGDTLFSAGCGRMFEGTPELFTNSLQTLAKLPDETAVYCTHEYTASNLRFAAYVEPQNTDILDYQEYVKDKRARNKITLPSTIALEKKINPFLHCTQPAVQEHVAKLSGQAINQLKDDPVKTFACMRALKDNF